VSLAATGVRYLTNLLVWALLNDRIGRRYDRRLAVAISRMKKVGAKMKKGGHCEAKEKVGGQHKYLSCMVIFRCFGD